MKLVEITGDIFENPRECYMQCISADFKMGLGIAKDFRDRFHVKDKLTTKWGNYQSYFKKDGGGAIATTDPLVVSLVTKLNYYDKPTYESMDISLKQAAMLLEAWGVFEVSMPMIGCGLDKLNWDKVKKLIEKNFKDKQMLITVYKKGADSNG
jgi:hypothetical protein